jgi:hypothetical protein
LRKAVFLYAKLLIHRDEEDASFFEILIIVTDNNLNDETVGILLAKYKFIGSEDDYNPLETELELSILSNRVSMYCYKACVAFCTTPWQLNGPSTLHIAQQGCTTAFEMCTEVCTETYSSSGPQTGYTGNSPVGGDSSNNTGAGGGGTNGGGSPDPNSTNPPNQNGQTNNPPPLELFLDPVLEDEPTFIDPCDELKNLLKTQNDTFIDSTGTHIVQRPKLTQKIISLRPNTDTKKENGIELKFDKATESYSHNYANLAGNLATNLTVALTVGTDYWGSIHSHPKNGLAIPSFLDLVWLKDCYSYTKWWNRDRVVSIIVVKNPNGNTPATLTYAIKLNNPTDFIKKIKNRLRLFGQPNDIEDPTLDVVNKINKFELNLYKQNLNNSPPINLEQKFLKEYKDMGFSLYQANDQLTEWKEVKLNQNNEVQKNPCN